MMEIYCGKGWSTGQIFLRGEGGMRNYRFMFPLMIILYTIDKESHMRIVILEGEDGKDNKYDQLP